MPELRHCGRCSSWGGGGAADFTVYADSFECKRMDSGTRCVISDVWEEWRCSRLCWCACRICASWRLCWHTFLLFCQMDLAFLQFQAPDQKMGCSRSLRCTTTSLLTFLWCLRLQLPKSSSAKCALGLLLCKHYSTCLAGARHDSVMLDPTMSEACQRKTFALSHRH